jgi:type VI secretion system protein ImpE
MTAANELLAAGDLDGARATLVEAVKRSPDDQGARMFLFQLLAVCGEWDKAVAQARALASLSAEAQMMATVYNQAVAAEKRRLEAWAGRQPFEVLSASSPWIERLAEALGAMAQGRESEGEALRDQAFEEAGDTPGVRDEAKFAWVADIDPRLGPCFEAIVGGRWGLIPFEAVDVIKVDGPNDLRDVVWLPVQIMLRSGQSAAALLPARYPGTETETDSDLRLGRKTEWRNGAGPERPVGQKVWGFDDGEEAGLLTIGRLDFA